MNGDGHPGHALIIDHFAVSILPVVKRAGLNQQPCPYLADTIPLPANGLVHVSSALGDRSDRVSDSNLEKF